jgi:adducin
MLKIKKGLNLLLKRTITNKQIIIPINDLNREAKTEEELLRCKLASLYRLVDRYNLTYGIYNHISVRCPTINDNNNNNNNNDDNDYFLLNALGLNYEEVTASNLIKIDYKGNIIDNGSLGNNWGINRAGFVLHSAIHMARKDINCIIHIHTNSGAAISALKYGLLPISQEALIRQTLLSYHDYDGILIDDNFIKKIQSDLGNKNKLMILHNHGLVSCGNTIEEAWNHLFDLVYSCETQFRALSAAGGNINNLHIPNKNIQQQVFNVLSKMNGVQMIQNNNIKWNLGELEYEAEMRYLDLRGYNTGYPYKNKPYFLLN